MVIQEGEPMRCRYIELRRLLGVNVWVCVTLSISSCIDAHTPSISPQFRVDAQAVSLQSMGQGMPLSVNTKH